MKLYARTSTSAPHNGASENPEGCDGRGPYLSSHRPVAAGDLSRWGACGRGRTVRKPRSQPGGTRHTRARVTRDETVIVGLPRAASREASSVQHPAGHTPGAPGAGRRRAPPTTVTAASGLGSLATGGPPPIAAGAAVRGGDRHRPAATVRGVESDEVALERVRRGRRERRPPLQWPGCSGASEHAALGRRRRRGRRSTRPCLRVATSSGSSASPRVPRRRAHANRERRVKRRSLPRLPF